jgi:hypothetical protein
MSKAKDAGVVAQFGVILRRGFAFRSHQLP